MNKEELKSLVADLIRELDASAVSFPAGSAASPRPSVSAPSSAADNGAMVEDLTAIDLSLIHIFMAAPP